VYNAARSYLPELAALAANSPYLGGCDTGLASARLKLNEELPRAGVPPAFRTWKEYADFVAWGVLGKHFADPSYFWWDVRLHPAHGTLEFRMADAQTQIEEAGALTSVCQALVAALADRYDHGEALAAHDTHRIAQNRWRAIRDGLDGAQVDLDSGASVPTRRRVGELLAWLEPFAEALGSRNELIAAWTLLAENGAERQRRIAAESELGVDAVIRSIADETEQAATLVRARVA
jgi:glutamate---cysteine ligase / carboxylate-amine ligase